MTIRSTLIATTALLALAGCGQKQDNSSAYATNSADTFNQADASAPGAAQTPAMGASQNFVNTAAASDAFEIETSKLALNNGASASVKSFAKKMIDAHTASTAKLKTLTAGMTPALTPDPTLNAEQQQTLDRLKSPNGKAFDEAYIAGQAAGHQQTLDALKAYATTGDVPQLKSFATDLIPTVTAHLNMAKGLKA
jgi:putative membrane protein